MIALPLTLSLFRWGQKALIAVVSSQLLLLLLLLQGGEVSVVVASWLMLLLLLPTIAPPDTLFASQGSIIDLSSPASAKASEDTAVLFWTMTRNPLVLIEAMMAQEDGEDSNGEFSIAFVKSAIANCLKRNTSSRDLLVIPQQLKDMPKALIVN
jgi:hypothetical protein